MKRILLAVLLVVLLATGAQAAYFDTDEWVRWKDLSVSGHFAPPHNEPVLVWDSHVARYRIEGSTKIQLFGRLDVGVKLTAWGTNTWRTPEVVGHGWEAWGGSDWSWERTRYERLVSADFWITDRLAVSYEGKKFYWPDLDGPEGPDNSDGTYYHIVGFRYSFIGGK